MVAPDFVRGYLPFVLLRRVAPPYVGDFINQQKIYNVKATFPFRLRGDPALLHGL